MRDPLAHLPATKRKLVAPQADAHREFVVSQKTGEVRQAGADPHQQNWINEVRGRAERDLYFFTKVILKRQYLTPLVHKPVCAFIQRRPPMRKLLEMFRESGKTSIVGHALPLHIHIQPKTSNCYFPGEEGSEQRMTLVGETEKRATDALRVIKTNAEDNQLLRALWPHRFWANMKEAKSWSTTEIIMPRENEWPDPSIRALGVGAAVTGSHPSVLIKDDLVTFDAANSETIMQTAIDWHVASRALINKPGCLEFIIGCLPADALVLLENGTELPIADVSVGDRVWAADVDGSLQVRTVEAKIPQGVAKTVTVKTAVRELRATPNHPFLARRKSELVWVRADELVPHDQIISIQLDASAGLRQERVISVSANAVEEPVYDLTVGGTPSFFANGLAVHNTRWGVHDLYAYIEEQDPSVDIFKMPLSDPETNEINYPEFDAGGIRYGFSEAKRTQLQKEFGVLYPLLYENTATDPSLLDFSETDLRFYHLAGEELVFDVDARDAALLHQDNQIKASIPITHMRGMPLNGHTYDLLRQRERWLRTRVA